MNLVLGLVLMFFSLSVISIENEKPENLRILESALVTLSSIDQFPIVLATKNRKGVKRFILPRGTKASVIEWSPYFLNAGIFNVFDELSNKTKVKIINGPLKGKMLWVDNMYIEIE